MAFAFAAVLTASAQRQPRVPQDDTGLKDAYKDYFTIGVAVNKRNLADPAQTAIIKKEYNSVTAENDMKPGETASPTSAVRTASSCVATASAGIPSSATGC